MYLNSECTPTIILNSEPKTSSYNTKGGFMRLLNDANPCEVHERNFSIVSAIGQFFLNKNKMVTVFGISSLRHMSQECILKHNS